VKTAIELSRLRGRIAELRLDESLDEQEATDIDDVLYWYETTVLLGNWEVTSTTLPALRQDLPIMDGLERAVRSDLCEKCGKPALFWTGRSRTFFNRDGRNPIMDAGWCSDECEANYDNPTREEVRRLYEEALKTSRIAP
jgi:hypothetical protein